jgi:glyoxylase-like metal-dependent hydrolase (beta-lactamase superfamily II)
MGCNCYIVYETKHDEALIIDPGDDADLIISTLTRLNTDPLKIIATHGHFDHNMAAYELQMGYKIPFLISEYDLFLLKNMPKSAKYFSNVNTVIVPKPDGFLKKGQKISFDESFFEVIETPGHTPGSICLFNPIENILFAGDTIFKNGSIGRYDFSYSSKGDLFKSIDKIFSLSKETVIYPGHGEKTMVKDESIYHKKYLV